MTSEFHQFSTSDIDEAAYLIAIGGKLEQVDDSQNDPKVKVFVLLLTEEQEQELPRLYDRTKLFSFFDVVEARESVFSELRKKKRYGQLQNN